MADRQDLTRDQLAELFGRAREADIAQVAGLPLFRVGRRLRGECPLCHASKGKRGSGAFSVDPDARLWFCFGSCDDGGDVIDLEQRLRGGSLRDAAERLAGRVYVSPAPRERSAVQPRRVEGGGLTGPEKIARQIWANGVTGVVGPAWRYLTGRGLSHFFGLNYGFRTSLCAKWGWDPARGDWLCAPALIGEVTTPAGPTGGVHVTYLRPDGSGKARLDPAKRMWGPQKDTEGRPGGVWLTAINDPGPLVVGEGIESTLSAMQLLGGPCRGVATLSLGTLQGGWLTDQWGRIDPACVAGDPERPAFTWPEDPAHPWDEVLIAVDRDMGAVEVKVRKLGGGTVKRRLEAEDRARICAGLAVQAWKAAGANAVRVIAPGAGRDFNDELMARLG